MALARWEGTDGPPRPRDNFAIYLAQMTKADLSHRSASSSARARHSGATAPDGVERRNNPHLRDLIDEMLVTLRVAVNRELWTPEERSRSESELEGMMSRIRSQATQPLQ